MSGTVTVDDICSSDIINRIREQVRVKKESLQSRTAALWLQYMEMIDILMVFLKAERTGNWSFFCSEQVLKLNGNMCDYSCPVPTQ